MTEKQTEHPTSVEVEEVDALLDVTPPQELQRYMSASAKFDAQEALARWNHQKLVVSELRRVALAELRPSDFRIFGTTTYLQHKGAQRVQGLLGLRFPDEKPTVRRIDLGDGNFAYTVEGWVGSTTLNSADYVVGGRSSKDQFFDRFDDDGNRLPVSETELLKAAMTNWKNRAVSGLLGLQGMTPEELKELGFSAEKIEKVSFQKGGKGGAKKDVVPNFGPEEFADLRGKPWSEATPAALKWYRDVISKNVEDPEKSRWKAANQRTLDAIKTEIVRRQDQARADKEGGQS